MGLSLGKSDSGQVVLGMEQRVGVASSRHRWKRCGNGGAIEKV